MAMIMMMTTTTTTAAMMIMMPRSLRPFAVFFVFIAPLGADKDVGESILSPDLKELGDSSDEISKRLQTLEEEGKQYLQKVMKQLQEDKSSIEEVPVSSNVDYGNAVEAEGVEYDGDGYEVISLKGENPSIEVEVHPGAPPLTISKEQLQALYDAAIDEATYLVQNGENLVESESSAYPPKNGSVKPPSIHGQPGNSVSGYHYYYFPIKSFFTPGKPEHPTVVHPTKPEMTTPAPHQVHATITMVNPQNKAVEPLFMAISSFIGMALMFFFSVLFVPRFKKMKPKSPEFKDTEDDVADFAGIVLEAMAGRDCSERFACEVVRVFRGIKPNSKALRILEIVLPPKLSQQISQIRKSAANKRARCGYIPCKAKKPARSPTTKAPAKIGTTPKPGTKKMPAKNRNEKPKPWKEKKSAHDLWMTHFDKNKVPVRNRKAAPTKAK